MKLAVLAVVAAVVLSGCSAVGDNDVKRLALPVAGSDRSHAMWDVWLGAWIAVLVVFLLVFGLIVYSMIRYRRRSDDEVPVQIRYNLPIEALYTFAPVIIVAVFFFHTVTSQNEMLEKVKNPDHTVEVVGSKWQWAFNYLDEDATQGEDVFDIGTPAGPDRAVAPGRRVRALQPGVARRHPLVLGPRVLLQDGRRSRQGQHVRHDADPRGRLHRPLRRAVRPLPLAHDLQGPRGLQGRVRGAPASSSRTTARPARPRAPRKPHTIAGLGKRAGDVEDVQGTEAEH